MTDKLSSALNNVECTYKELVEISNNILDPIVGPANTLVSTVNAQINSLSIDQIRDFILQLQLKAFELAEIKEKATMKAELSEALQKEKFATTFNGLDGSAAVKEKIALVESSSETVSTVLYELISSLLKSKVDQLHRLVDCLKSILMSRMQETKFMNIGTTAEVGAPINNTRTRLVE